MPSQAQVTAQPAPDAPAAPPGPSRRETEAARGPGRTGKLELQAERINIGRQSEVSDRDRAARPAQPLGLRRGRRGGEHRVAGARPHPLRRRPRVPAARRQQRVRDPHRPGRTHDRGGGRQLARRETAERRRAAPGARSASLRRARRPLKPARDGFEVALGPRRGTRRLRRARHRVTWSAVPDGACALRAVTRRDVKRHVQRPRAVREPAHRHVVHAGRRDRPRGLWRDPLRRPLSSRVPAQGRLLRPASVAACCRAARHRPRGRAPRAVASSVSTSTSTLTIGPTARRTRWTAGPIPPAIAMWLSFTSTASSRPNRWLTPPPIRTAYFSSARSPGVVFRVHRTRVP